MRDDWDQLFFVTEVEAVTEDLQVDGLDCRWFRSPSIAHPAVILYVHGGGFRLGSLNSHQKLMSDIACIAQCQVLGVNYQCMPDAVFPIQLEQVVGVYRWLIDRGHAAKNVLIAGDSAGGSIAAGLMQWIKQDLTETLPQPAGAILLSAWLDLTLSGESYVSREGKDPVHQTRMLESLARLYAGQETDLENPLLSPLFGDLAGLPPTLLQVGDHEVGLSDSITYAEKMQAAGARAQISVWPEMIHVFQMFPDELPDARKAIQEIGTFVHTIVPVTERKPAPYVSRSKVNPPPASDREIKRVSLLDDVGDHQSTRKLTLLQAPAGYGKSTAMCQVLERFRQQGVTTLWLNFDDADNDMSRFLAAFGLAVAPYSKKLTEASYKSPRNQELAHWIIESLNAIAEPTAIFFDNLEAIRNPAVLGLIARGIEALATNCCIFIASRTAPPIGLAKLAARDQLNSIQIADLRFNESETRDFFVKHLDSEILDEQTRQLYRRTDGWPVALKLAALALHGKTNAEQHIANFSGTNAAVAAYLAEEVLISLPASTQDFLLQSSIFDEISVSICDRVLQRSDSKAVLDDLQARNLFVSNSNEQSDLFQYHSLFRDFLRTQLPRRHPQVVGKLHRSAGQVYLDHGRPIPAIRHTLKAGDADLALELLNQYADQLVSHGRIGLLTQLLDQISPRRLDEHVHLKLIYALCLTYTRGPRPAYELVANLDESSLPADSAAHLIALRSVQLGMMDRIQEAHDNGLAAQEKMTDSAPNARIILSQALTQTSIILGEHQKARAFCDRARFAPSSNVDIFNLVLAESAESGMELMAGQLRQARRRIDLAIERKRNDENRRGRGIAMASIQLAEILYEQGDSESARPLLATNSALVQDMGPPDSLIAANVVYSRILADEGDYEHALQLLIELETSGHRLHLPRVVASARLERSRLWLEQGDINGAREQLELARRTYDWDGAKMLWFAANDTLNPEITELRWYLRNGNTDKALPLARTLLKSAEHARRVRRTLKLRVLLAEAQFKNGDHNAAFRTMNNALHFAAQEGFVSTFLEEGPALTPLFNEMGVSAPGFHQVGQSNDGHPMKHVQAPSMEQANAAMPNDARLTKKEMDVLSVLAMGLSNIAMAEKLFVSESTIRTHLRNINSKLNARSRTEALSIARQLGLIG